MSTQPKPLKVFGGDCGPGLRYHVVVATTSQKRAAELLGVTLHTLRDYYAETWNPAQVAAAMTQPETPLYAEYRNLSAVGEYTPRKPWLKEAPDA